MGKKLVAPGEKKDRQPEVESLKRVDTGDFSVGGTHWFGLNFLTLEFWPYVLASSSRFGWFTHFVFSRSGFNIKICQTIFQEDDMNFEDFPM